MDSQTGTIRVAILFPNPENILRPGQYAKVRALMKTEKGAMLVPQRAVGELQGSYQVAVVDADNTVRIRNVKVGERIGNLWVIQEGLKPGERVVAEGIQKVGDGVKVTPKPLCAEAVDAMYDGLNGLQAESCSTHHDSFSFNPNHFISRKVDL